MESNRAPVYPPTFFFTEEEYDYQPIYPPGYFTQMSEEHLPAYPELNDSFYAEISANFTPPPPIAVQRVFLDLAEAYMSPVNDDTPPVVVEMPPVDAETLTADVVTPPLDAEIPHADAQIPFIDAEINSVDAQIP